MGSTTLKLREHRIYVHVNFGRKKQKRYATDYSVNEIKNWDVRTKKVKNVTAEPKSMLINSKLQELVLASEQLLDDSIRNNFELNNDLIKEVLDGVTNKGVSQKDKSKYSLLSFYKWFIDYYEDNPHPSSNKPLSNGTIRTYRTALKKLQDYNDTIKKVDFDDITLDFHKSYTSYLQNKKYSNNYIGNQFKQLKAIMNASLERNIHNNIEFRKRSFSKITEKVDHIYLTGSEIDKIECTQLTTDKHKRARDLFLIQCYTAMRVGDLMKLTSENLKATKDGTRYLEYVQSKTGKTVQVPLSRKFLALIERNDNKLPKKMSEQKINDYIKEIAEIAELNEIIHIEKTIGGKTVRTPYKKYEIISNHTGRRSFCTNAYLADMSTIDIMAMSGHTSETVFYRYIKVTPTERLQRLSKHIFFK
ncbi:tyrosine-type recombinase/integrase [Dokdonia sp. Hel_I_53]|uniref:tyrosine-type recombinase/integrase n=1 Tax=Dokdonia sp. Hel_I_53 TaxID=1566287 RepID=UPI00119BA7E0|nr:site-specific integrase [Dokdonia sp. Hel_I_53]TVZ52258.1 site-specific recombinase XerD [Dokdonia sp. Hel_I_53]